MQLLKPDNPSKLNYFQLSREFNAHWLIYSKYKNLLWYWDQYEEIKKFDKFNEDLIKNKQK